MPDRPPPPLPPPALNVIVAAARNRVIGRAGRLPWQIPEDWRYFLESTRGGSLVIGRIGYEEMRAAGEIRGDRRFLVVTQRTDLPGPAVEPCPTLAEALRRARASAAPIWICGGERLYAETLPLAQRLFLTAIEAEVDGDTRFPEWSHLFSLRLWHRPGTGGGFSFAFQVWERPGATGTAIGPGGPDGGPRD